MHLETVYLIGVVTLYLLGIAEAQDVFAHYMVIYTLMSATVNILTEHRLALLHKIMHNKTSMMRSPLGILALHTWSGHGSNIGIDWTALL